MLTAMCGALLDRPLTLQKRAVLYAAVLGLTDLEAAQDAQATLDLVVQLLRNPTPAMQTAVHGGQLERSITNTDRRLLSQ